jgi:hypothetical protein
VSDAPDHAPTPRGSLRERYAGAETLDAFIARARHYPQLWRDMRARARVPDDLVDRARRLEAPRHLLVLLEDWCGDAINTIPVLAALVDAVAGLELRVLARDAHPDLMDARLTHGTRAIPAVMVLDEQFEEIAWWGPRPAVLQLWATSPEARSLTVADRYREIRRWYVRDRGRSTLTELVELLERASTAAPRAA